MSVAMLVHTYIATDSRFLVQAQSSMNIVQNVMPIRKAVVFCKHSILIANYNVDALALSLDNCYKVCRLETLAN